VVADPLTVLAAKMVEKYYLLLCPPYLYAKCWRRSSKYHSDKIMLNDLPVDNDSHTTIMCRADLSRKGKNLKDAIFFLIRS
jgi:hypothetical protein